MHTFFTSFRKMTKHFLSTIVAVLLIATTANAQNWNQIIKAAASDRAAADNFGHKVAISGDYAIVGAYTEDEDAGGANTLADAGSAYIFQRVGANWVQQQKLVASDRGAGDWFGFSVAISGDYAIVGAYNEDEDVSGVSYTC